MVSFSVDRAASASSPALPAPPAPAPARSSAREKIDSSAAGCKFKELRLRHAPCTSAADAASGRSDPGGFREMRSELRYLPTVPVSELLVAGDDIARQHRELDVRIQRVNWEADLAD